jgi:hypothetical protein
VKLNEALIGLSKTLFSYQIFVVAETTPDTHFVVQHTTEKSHELAAKLRSSVAAPHPHTGPKRARRNTGKS